MLLYLYVATTKWALYASILMPAAYYYSSTQLPSLDYIIHWGVRDTDLIVLHHVTVVWLVSPASSRGGGGKVWGDANVETEATEEEIWDSSFGGGQGERAGEAETGEGRRDCRHARVEKKDISWEESSVQRPLLATHTHTMQLTEYLINYIL